MVILCIKVKLKETIKKFKAISFWFLEKILFKKIHDLKRNVKKVRLYFIGSPSKVFFKNHTQRPGYPLNKVEVLVTL